ncbi:23S ribosomal RNA methyltransferase Erm [Saccharothrix variisporea]|uniref:23S rRNA (Adenine-N6)-dimethyltransferase n=1 Tax=Saccharothrix variisporea TaxID=543527 RepID=A0A495X1F3_9PSEU|nr:23S ribosomal RNA methyltransferase Erm [Saccharothrix variisporea]RKT67034.1 23S rRNA (adenine-N6)-dimethyltransferase [Saccharothrix variisporea]
MRTQYPGRHELGQNFLTDRTVVAAVVRAVAATPPLPIVEIGAGDGALTLPLQALGRPVTAIEVDRRLATSLAARVGPTTTVVAGDFLTHRLPRAPHVLVGNLPFHRTTAMLRRVLRAGHWTSAVLLVQWEVARRRAGVGGATLMTAQWWPWFDFALLRRVPAAAFTPRPGVDGGLLTLTRRPDPLVPTDRRATYQDFVHRAFTGRGRGARQVLTAAAPARTRPAVTRWTRRHLPDTALPRDLTAGQWADLFALTHLENM